MKSESEILDKIRKLLRLADRSRGATENEAKVALTKAQELMTRHNIDSALLRMERGESGGGSFKVDKGNLDLPKTLNPADLMILSLLQAHFNVKTILMSGGRGTAVDIIGAPADIDFAIYAFNYLRQTFFRCWNEFKRTNARPTDWWSWIRKRRSPATSPTTTASSATGTSAAAISIPAVTPPVKPKAGPSRSTARSRHENQPTERRKTPWTCPIRQADGGCHDNSIHP
jgi:hypothetical protein